MLSPINYSPVDPMTEQIVFLNGRFIPLSQATVSVLDRGFIFGDGIYDVIPVYGRKLFRSKQHLDRLARSLAAVGIGHVYDDDQWLSMVERVVKEFDCEDQMVYMQVTRGVAKRGHAFPLDAKPTVFIMAMPLPVPSREMRENGVACVTMEDQRWLHCDIKSISLLGNVLAAQNAAENGAVETIQFRGNVLTEASSSNVWIAKDGKLMGPKKNNLVLEGIRYGLFEELCARGEIPFELRNITRDEVFAADEVLLSSCAKEVLPVTLLDGEPVGCGKPGPVYARLYEMYQAAKAAEQSGADGRQPQCIVN
jgi:D-alanine transaminase